NHQRHDWIPRWCDAPQDCESADPASERSAPTARGRALNERGSATVTPCTAYGGLSQIHINEPASAQKQRRTGAVCDAQRDSAGVKDQKIPKRFRPPAQG